MERQFLELSRFPSSPKHGRKLERKYILVLQANGGGSFLGNSVDQVVAFGAERAYDGVILLRPGGTRHELAHDTLALCSRNVFGVLEELAHQLTEDDLLLTALLGQTVQHDRVLSFSAGTGYVSCRELVHRLRQVRAHCVDYVTTQERPGTLAYYLGNISHPDFGLRHVGVSPVQPSVSLPAEPYQSLTGQRYPTAFHIGFFASSTCPISLGEQFARAQNFQSTHNPSVIPYMHTRASRPLELQL